MILLLTLSSTHLSRRRRLLNSHRRPVLVMAYVESAISPLPQATSTKSLFRCSPNMADRPIKGTGSLYCNAKNKHNHLDAHKSYQISPLKFFFLSLICFLFIIVVYNECNDKCKSRVRKSLIIKFSSIENCRTIHFSMTSKTK